MQGVPREDRDVGKLAEPSPGEHLSQGGNVGQENEHQQNQAAKEEAEAGDYCPAVLGALALAHDSVEGEQNGGQQSQPCPQQIHRGLEGIDNGDGARHLQHQSSNMPG